MRSLIAFFLLNFISNSIIAWEFRSPQFTPNWVATDYRSEISLRKSELRENPSDTTTLARIGYLYTLRKQLKQAHRFINLASLKGADDPFFLLSKGLLHSALKENKVAEKFLFKALLKSRQESPEYFFYFADHLSRAGDPIKSIHWLQLGLKLYPSQPQLLTLLAWNFLSVSNWNRAEVALMKARQVYPQYDHYISVNLAKMYAILGNWDASIYNLRRAVLKGYRDHYKIKLDQVFQPLKDHPQFILLINQAQKNEEQFLNHNRFTKI